MAKTTRVSVKTSGWFPWIWRGFTFKFKGDHGRILERVMQAVRPQHDDLDTEADE